MFLANVTFHIISAESDQFYSCCSYCSYDFISTPLLEPVLHYYVYICCTFSPPYSHPPLFLFWIVNVVSLFPSTPCLF